MNSKINMFWPLLWSMWLHKWTLPYNAEWTSLSPLIWLYWSCGIFFFVSHVGENNVLTLLNWEWACLLSKIRLLSHSPGNSVWMGLIKPSWSKTPDKDAYLESVCSQTGKAERKFIFWTILEVSLAQENGRVYLSRSVRSKWEKINCIENQGRCRPVAFQTQLIRQAFDPGDWAG